jgi:hypothetical protein
MRAFLLIGAVLLAAAGWSAANAGGIGDDEGNGTDSIFFGTVTDTRGSAIAGAHVNVKFKSMSFVGMTDIIGGYRISTTTDPDQSVISCSKDGYRQSAVMRRTPPGAASGPVEIDCTMAPAR